MENLCYLTFKVLFNDKAVLFGSQLRATFVTLIHVAHRYVTDLTAAITSAVVVSASFSRFAA
jgi:hypothetical protein